jgi:ribosomal protein L14E/L6E/L27E
MRGVKSPDIVFSIAGHDRERPFIVLGTQEGKVLLVDGKERKLAKPKVKSLKHIRFGKAAGTELTEAICRGTATDRLIRTELAKFRGEVGG